MTTMQQSQSTYQSRQRNGIQVPAFVANRGACLVEELSASGAVLLGCANVGKGDEIQIRLDFPTGRPLRVGGHVVSAVSPHCGAAEVRFDDIHPDTEDRIHDLVLHHFEARAHQSLGTVLVVDDCEAVRRVLCRQISQLGRRVVQASNPHDAVMQLDWSAYAIDAAVVDLHLGSESGLDVLDYLSQDLPQVRRVLISGQAQPWQLDLARASSHAHAVLPKPWSALELASAIAA